MSVFTTFYRGPLGAALLILLLGTTGCSSPTDEPARSPAPGDNITERIFDVLEPHVTASMQRQRTPGVVLALTDRKGLVGVRTWGYADIKAKAPVTEGTLFQIGSITKSFTALALLQEQEKGRIDIDEPVTRYLPWFTVQTIFKPITVRHLLSHTAGIPANRDDIYSSPYMAVALAQQGTAWSPGSQFLYSNVGYQVLHALLLSVTSQPYVDLIRERFFGPLSMPEARPRERCGRSDRRC